MSLFELAKDGLVHIAALFTVAGMFCKEQLLLRALLLVGTMLYIAYYIAVPAQPLWDAVLWSTAMLAVNAFMMAKIMVDRSPRAMNDDERRLYQSFAELTPGQFRELMRLGTWKVADENTILTHEGMPVRSLFYVHGGRIEVSKKERTFTLPPLTFIGEVAFLLDRPASATVVLKSGARFIEWSAAPLSRLMARRPLLKDAMGARFNADLAMKVSSA